MFKPINNLIVFIASIFCLFSCKSEEKSDINTRLFMLEYKLNETNKKVDSLYNIINALPVTYYRNKNSSSLIENTPDKFYCVFFITGYFPTSISSNDGVLTKKQTAFSSIFETADTSEDFIYKYLDEFQKKCNRESTLGEIKVVNRGYRFFVSYKLASKFIENETEVE